MRSVEIDDVAVDLTDNQLTFRLIISKPPTGSKSQDDLNKHQPTTTFAEPPTILFRNYKQIYWLHTMLLEKYPMVLIPPLPEKPGSHADAVYIEKKRLQVERYLAKVFARSELVDSSDLSYFLSDRMNTLDVAKTRSVVQSIARLIPFKALLPSDYQNGFRIFSPSDFIDGADDQEEFMRRRSYILLMESNLTRLVESAVRIIKRKEQTSKLMHQLAYALKDPIVTMNNTDDTDVAVAADRRLAPSSKSFEELYQAFGDLKDISLKQMRQEIYQFSDVILECKNTVASVKRIMNGRTDFLIAYTEAIRHKTSCFEKTQKLRLQLSGKEIEYNEAKRVELQAEQAVEEAKKMFEQSKLSLTREMIRFERERARDIRKALRDYASQQLESGRQRVEILQSIHFPTKEL